jgi:hypothetical protein
VSIIFPAPEMFFLHENKINLFLHKTLVNFLTILPKFLHENWRFRLFIFLHLSGKDIYTPHNKVVEGYTGFTMSVRLSVLFSKKFEDRLFFQTKETYPLKVKWKFTWIHFSTDRWLLRINRKLGTREKSTYTVLY